MSERNDLNLLISEQLEWFVLGMAAILLIIGIIMIMQAVKLSKLRKRYNAMMAGTGVSNLEELLVDLRLQLDKVEDEQSKQGEQMKSTIAKMHTLKGNMGVKRYNAFNEGGSELSFSMAILDDEQNGVVLTAIHSRETSYVYAKPMLNGESRYALSPEEKEAIALALQK